MHHRYCRHRPPCRRSQTATSCIHTCDVSGQAHPKHHPVEHQLFIRCGHTCLATDTKAIDTAQLTTGQSQQPVRPNKSQCSTKRRRTDQHYALGRSTTLVSPRQRAGAERRHYTTHTQTQGNGTCCWHTRDRPLAGAEHHTQNRASTPTPGPCDNV